jgi:uncharacterized metal-binding protein YceD (DUF177 family)
MEFSRPVDVMRLHPAGADYELVASAEECAALARRFDLLGLGRLTAQVQLKPVAGGFYRLAAQLEAEVTQACIVTLEPVAQCIEDEFSLLYGALDAQEEVLLDGVSETVEPLEGGMIDIGEAVAQQLSLALDPFPRAETAPQETGETQAGPGLDSPFAALAKLRPRGGD